MAWLFNLLGLILKALFGAANDRISADRAAGAQAELGVQTERAAVEADRADTEHAIAAAEANAPHTRDDALERLKDHSA